MGALLGRPATEPGQAQVPRQEAGPAGMALPIVAALAVLFTVALTFASLEAPRWLTGVLNPWIEIPDYHPMNPAPIADFMANSLVRPLGYTSLGLVLLLVLVGLATSKAGLSALGAVVLFLPTFGYFTGYMFFLAGLGVLRALWLPFWSEWMALGDVAYAPYVLVVWPLSLVGIDVRFMMATLAIAAGLFIFATAVAAWIAARSSGRELADRWVYRVSRHPQYLGWILWSWGFMVFAGLQPTARGGQNPGAAFPWVLSTLVIVAVAWREEATMRRQHGERYEAYRRRTPFLAPHPQPFGRLAALPLRFVLRKDQPESGLEAVAAIAVYLVLAIVASLPFVATGWPPGGWWAWPT